MSGAYSTDACCMRDNRGRPVTEWLPRMQSTRFLRNSIARGERTSECWTEMKARNERVRAALHSLKGQP